MNNMMNMNMGNLGEKMMNRFFRKVDNVVWDMVTGKIGVLSEDGIASISGEGDDAQIELNLMDQFGMPVPAFAQSTPVDSVAVGDLIYGNGRPKGWVVSVKESKSEGVPKKFKIMTPSGTTTTWTPPKVAMLGFDSGVMVLRSLLNMFSDKKESLGTMQSMLMPMLMMGGDNVDLDTIMPLMLMGQLGMSGDGSDAMGMNNMFQMMMMSQLMGGKGGFGRNPGSGNKSGPGFFNN